MNIIGNCTSIKLCSIGNDGSKLGGTLAGILALKYLPIMPTEVNF